MDSIDSWRNTESLHWELATFDFRLYPGLAAMQSFGRRIRFRHHQPEPAIQALRHSAELNVGRTYGAIRQLQEAERMNPGYAEIRKQLLSLLDETGRGANAQVRGANSRPCNRERKRTWRSAG